ncbi:SIMPL domain-containing protein [Fusibacter bizertensis]|uniref:SIMPL domain-containing protein n=1 Tax=Fusibacter bizertensis TaxID=1488331 RepID=A0ABT6ND74_9FIRM|nr:SIMPL domain-containing protein [Fusibacter bizertensis]MDH8678341.1 SIMPL domain-containing protein [Fusibacter bizertensis]
MKNKLLVGISALLVLVMAFGVFTLNAPNNISMADVNDTNTRLVTVNGEGKIVVTPDLAYIDLGVQTKNADASIAQQENAKLMTEVIKAIKAAGIDADDIKTTGYNLYQTYDYSADKQSDPYYVASNIVNVKIKDISKVGTIIDAASNAGANNVNNIRFTVSDDSQYYQEALKLAMTNAKGKATAIMSTFNKTPDMPYSVSEVSYGGTMYYDYSPAKALSESAVSTPIESGEITITANVSVGYDY